MKTSLLQQLSKEITQGEWKADRVSVFNLTHGMLHKHVATAELGASECEHNAQAISLTPQLIREVLELRECLTTLDKASTNYFYGDNRVAPVGTTTHSDYCDAKRKVKSLLARHETTN